jgi:hypothetical protein
MAAELRTQLGSAYLRLQADRCQRLSRSCMDLGVARDLSLMSEEYLIEASRHPIEFEERRARSL